jgi:hypothetical protein
LLMNSSEEEDCESNHETCKEFVRRKYFGGRAIFRKMSSCFEFFWVLVN